MFWLLVFATTALVLAWRGIRLSHATGVLGIVVLFYGWLGESGGHFLMLLAAYLAVFVPLNTPALRQEWISRVLLEGLLQHLPPLPKPGELPIAPLLEGEWNATLPAAGPQRVQSLEADALLCLLHDRLGQPLQPYRPGLTQAALASHLYQAAALRAFGLGQPAFQQHWLAIRLGQDLAWPLAQHQAALTSRLPPALGQSPLRSPSASLLETARAHHSGYRALLEAAHLDNPHQALIAFDLALFAWLRAAIRQCVRALVNSFSGGRLIPLQPALQEETDVVLHRAVFSAQTRLAVLCHLLLACDAYCQTKKARALIAPLQLRLADLLITQVQLQALLQFHASAMAPNLERPLVVAATRTSLLQAESLCWQATAELPVRPLRWLLRVLLFGPGRQARPLDYRLQQAAAGAVLEHPEVRQRLLAGATQNDATADAFARCAALTRLAGPLQQLADAQLQPPPANDAARLEAGLRMGFLKPEQHALLVEAHAFAQTLVPSPQTEPETHEQ